MQIQRAFVTTGALSLAFAGSAVAGIAAPPIWETDYGTALASLMGEDDEAQEVNLSFAFPFANNSYTSLFAGTNGAVGLGGLGEADDYPSEDEFIDTSDPMIAPFWSDMDMESMGTVWFNDFGERAVLTWDEIGSYQNELAPYTFQLQLFDDGTIIFGYNGISELNEANLDTIVHVGLTEGNLDAFPADVDYLGDSPFTSADTVLQRFDYDPGQVFGLDGMNLMFTPLAEGGYEITTVIPAPPVLALLILAGIAGGRRRN